MLRTKPSEALEGASLVLADVESPVLFTVVR